MHRLARYRSGRVELWITPCVVTMPPPKSTALIVPTNERLCGTQFAHFPKGGPTPAAPVIGERDYDRPRAERLLYQCESVDGIVTEFGGAAYESAIAELPIVSGDADYPVRCKTGGAVRVPVATGPLAAFGDGLILAVPPFYASLSCFAAHLAWQVESADLSDPANLGARFRSNGVIAPVVLVGIAAATLNS